MTTSDNPTIVTLAGDYPDGEWDPHYAREAIESGKKAMKDRIPRRYANAVASAPEVADWVRAVVHRAVTSDRPMVPTVNEGPSLLLVGPVGTGKTHQSYGALRALSVSGVLCSWSATTAADAYARLRPRHGVDSESEFRRLANAPVLFIDDMGAAKGSEWTEEINYRLINHRYEHVLPTLITSNVPPRALADELGERVASRLVEMADRVVLQGEDRRRTMQRAA